MTFGMMNDHTAPALNLQSHRASPGVWNRRGWNGTADLTPLTRLMLGVGGGALALQGLRRRGLVGSAMTWAGSTLAWWAVTGRSPVPAARQRLAEARARLGQSPDAVHQNSAASFPASDPPSWTPAVAGGRGQTWDGDE